MSDNGILRILDVTVCGDHILQLQFNDGTSKKVNLQPLLRGRVFEPLTDPLYFRKVSLDKTSGTVVWPNGADFAPEALYDLPAET
jgi:hypothetical protein